jgi:hypothetical protein
LNAVDATAASGASSMFGVYGPAAAPTTAIQLGFRPGLGIVAWTWGGNTLVNFAPHAPIGQWNHYVVTYNAISGQWLLYINAVQVAASTSAQQAGVLSQTFVNGFPTGGASESSNFLINDACFFNRTLGLQEIQTIYHLAGSRDGIVSGALCKYTFDEGAINSPVTTVRNIVVGAAVNMAPGAGTAATYIQPIVMSNVRRLP